MSPAIKRLLRGHAVQVHHNYFIFCFAKDKEPSMRQRMTGWLVDHILADLRNGFQRWWWCRLAPCSSQVLVHQFPPVLSLYVHNHCTRSSFQLARATSQTSNGSHSQPNRELVLTFEASQKNGKKFEPIWLLSLTYCFISSRLFVEMLRLFLFT